MKYTDVAQLMRKTAVDWKALANKAQVAAQRLPSQIQALDRDLPEMKRQHLDNLDTNAARVRDIGYRTSRVMAALGVDPHRVADVNSFANEVADSTRGNAGAIGAGYDKAKEITGILSQPFNHVPRSERQAARRAEMARIQAQAPSDAARAWLKGFTGYYTAPFKGMGAKLRQAGRAARSAALGF